VGRKTRAITRWSLILSLVIGALVGLVVVAFILLTGRLAARMYPAGKSAARLAMMTTRRHTPKSSSHDGT